MMVWRLRPSGPRYSVREASVMMDSVEVGGGERRSLPGCLFVCDVVCVGGSMGWMACWDDAERLRGSWV